MFYNRIFDKLKMFYNEIFDSSYLDHFLFEFINGCESSRFPDAVFVGSDLNEFFTFWITDTNSKNINSSITNSCCLCLVIIIRDTILKLLSIRYRKFSENRFLKISNIRNGFAAWILQMVLNVWKCYGLCTQNQLINWVIYWLLLYHFKWR